MGKLIVLVMALMFSSCTGSGSNGHPKVQPKLFAETAQERQEEQEVANEVQVPAEPEYETVYYYEVKNTNCYENDIDRTGSTPSCGITFSKCDDGYVYGCLTNVPYKVKSKEVRIE